MSMVTVKKVFRDKQGQLLYSTERHLEENAARREINLSEAVNALAWVEGCHRLTEDLIFEALDAKDITKLRESLVKTLTHVDNIFVFLKNYLEVI